MPRRFLFLTLAAGLLWLPAGCAKSEKKVSIHGAIINNGKPLTTSSKGFVQVTFLSADVSASQSYPANVDSQKGTYEIQRIPVGTYKVAVQQMDPAPVHDKLKGAFNAAHTKIVRDVTTDGQVDIDLGQP